MKWFKNPQTLEDLKKQYKRLALANHPDRGGTTEAMQEINAEYEKLFDKLKNHHVNAQGENYEKDTTETPEEFMDVISRLIHLDGIEIELCGSWIWVTGNTREHKEELKTLSFRWSSNKKAWYYHRDGYKKRSRRKMSLDDIRAMYGSERVREEGKTALTA